MSDSTGDSSDNYEDDPIIVFDQETESSNGFDSDQQQQSPIGFGFRQPSFVRLHGEPIPKGFDSLADFRAEKPPVKVEPFVDFHINNNSNMNPNSYSSLNTNQNQTSNSIHELLQRRNSRKWEEMGYDPKIMEKSLNRNTSQSAFVPSEIAITAGGHISSSFTNIDSFKIDEKHQIQNDLILETVLEESPIKITDFNQNSNSINNNNINSNSNNQNGKVLAIDENSRKNNNNKLTRSLSSGEVFPSIEMPANEENSSSNYIPFCTELCKDLNEYNYEEEDSYESCEDCNIPPNLLPFLVHERGTFTYRALDGETLKGLQESAVELITDNLNYYLEIAIENNMFSEMCYLQVIIEKLKNDNSGLSINEMSEIDYRICETSTDIDDILRLFKQHEMIIIEEKEKNMQLLNRRFTDSMQKLKEEWQAEINSVQQGKIFNSNYYPASSLPSSVNAENKLQNSINIFNVDIQSKYKASEARLRKMYNIEKEAIENNYSTKYSSLIHLKEQKLHPLSQRLEHLKRQRYEMSKEQMKFSSQSDLLKPKAASSRPSRNLSNKITSFLKNPRLNLIPITPIQYQLARPRTPGGPTICKPRAQNDGSYFH